MSDEILMDIQRTLGRIEGNQTGFKDALTAHIERDEKIDKALFERIEALQASHNKQKGAMTILGTIGAMIGAGIGYFVEWKSRH